jgi:hypothetical protein
MVPCRARAAPEETCAARHTRKGDQFDDEITETRHPEVQVAIRSAEAGLVSQGWT